MGRPGEIATYERIRKGVLHNVAGEHEEVDVTRIGFQDRQLLIDRLLKIALDDNERFLLKLRNRIDKGQSFVFLDFLVP